MKKLEKITEQCVVALTWTLTDSVGQELDVLDDPVEFLVGGDDLLSAIDAALIGKAVGDTIDLYLQPEHAFGDYDEKLVFLESRDKFPDDIEEGMCFEGLPDGCNPEADPHTIYAITELYPEHVVLDGNHPLAGIAIKLHAKIHTIRDATINEVGMGTSGTGFFKVENLAGNSERPNGVTLH